MDRTDGPDSDLDARLAAVDAALSSESLLPLPLDLVTRVLASVERETAPVALESPAPVPLRRFAWRAAAAAAAIALGAHLAFQADALASVESIATWRLPAAEGVTAPLGRVLDAGREEVRSIAGDVPALGSLGTVADADAGDSLGTPALLAGGAALVGAGLAVAFTARRRLHASKVGRAAGKGNAR